MATRKVSEVTMAESEDFPGLVAGPQAEPIPVGETPEAVTRYLAAQEQWYAEQLRKFVNDPSGELLGDGEAAGYFRLARINARERREQQMVEEK